jgi:nucleoside-diphosphate-sugar epimerase
MTAPAANAQRVLVIGGLGFIGINLTRSLLASGAMVTVLTPSRARRIDAASAVAALGGTLVEGDLRDERIIRRSVAGQNVVFNLAAQSGAVLSMEDPFTDLDVNCRGNLTLLEALRHENPTAKLVFPGSRLQYGRVTATPVAETHNARPLCMHGAHKNVVEQYLAIYRDAYGIRSTALRITNPYGPGQPFDDRPYGVVNRIIRLALENQPIPIYGDGAQVRDYVFIDDVVDALATVGWSPIADGRTYNVGSGVGTRLIDMAHAIQRVVGGGRVEFVAWPPLAERIETGDFVADVSQSSADTGWRPRVGIEDGLRRTVGAHKRE